MDFQAIAAQIESGLAGGDATTERRAQNQAPDRLIGRVIGCTGSRATLTADMSSSAPGRGQGWSIGSLITVHGVDNRIVGFVNAMTTAEKGWAEGRANSVLVDVELVGEITDNADGSRLFQRGIQNYPHMGAEAHRIRSVDLATIYDLGERKGSEIGKLSQDMNIPATVQIDDMLKRHFAVVGTTGVGKSNAVSILVRAAVEAKPNLRALILDPHNEFAAAFRGSCAVLDGSSMDLPFWLFRFEEFVDVVFRGRMPPEGEQEFLREGIAQAKQMYDSGKSSAAPNSILKRQFRPESGAVTADTPVPFRMNDLNKLIDDEMGRLDPRYRRADLRSLKARLESLSNDPSYHFLFGKSSIDDSIEPVVGQIFRIPDRGQRITVLQLAGIPSDVINSVVSVLARLSFDVAMLSNGNYEVLLLCEEAHRYVPHDIKAGFTPTRQAIARIAKEGRKYGCYLGVVTQRPGELDQTILSQCSTIFAMRLSNDRDQEIIRSALPDSAAGVIGFISAIGNREAIAFGEAIATPMRMRFNFLGEEKRPMPAWYEANTGGANTMDLRTITDRMRGQGISDQNQDMLPQMESMPGGGQAYPPQAALAQQPSSSAPAPLRTFVAQPVPSVQWPSTNPRPFGR